MAQTATAPHIQELIRALGEKIGEELNAADIEAEFLRYLEYGVPPEQAKRTILRNHGVTGSPGAATAASQERVTLEAIKPDAPFVNLLVRIVHVDQRTITVKGQEKKITSGILGDETMTRPFTSWNPIDVQKGDVLRVTGAYTKAWRDEPEVHFGDRVQIEKVSADALPAGNVASREFQLNDLKPGLRNVDVTARILQVEAREVTVQGSPKTVWSGLMGDATGKVQFSAWKDYGLKVGDVLRVTGGYVRGWRGTPQLTFDEKATVVKQEPASFPSLNEIAQSGPVPIARFIGGSGALDVTIEATILEVRPGSGLVHRCPECNRVVQGGACGLHGKVKGTADLRVKAILDDGTGAMNAIMNRQLTEQLLGKDLDACRKLAEEAATDDIVAQELKQRLTARPYRLRGNVLTDEYGPMLIASDASPVARDLAAAAEALLAEIAEAA